MPDRGSRDLAGRPIQPAPIPLTGAEEAARIIPFVKTALWLSKSAFYQR
jgi:hypothetical protein